jgi:tripartite-type tricarboxylate transporter receptor subunit TctC
LTLASIPAGTLQIAFEMLKRAANVEMTFVPYPGSAPAVNALLGEHVRRIETLPDVVTLAEYGFKGYEVDSWFGAYAPAKTPKETVYQLAGWFTAAMHVPEINAKLVMQGLYPVGMCGAEFGAYLRKQYDEYGRIIREANIKAE